MRQSAFVAAFFAGAGFLTAADPVLLNMIMPDAKVIAGANVTKVETSPLGQFLLHSMPTDKGFEQFVAASGFDPRTDVSEILVASNAAPKSGLVLARGHFNAAQIASVAAGSGQFTTSTYSGAQLIAPANSAGQALAIVLDSTPATIAVVGDLASVKAALDRRNGSNPLNRDLASKMAEYSGTDAWSVSLVPPSSFGAAGKANPLGGAMQGDLLKKVQQTSGGITFSSPIQIVAEAVADTAQNAAALGDVIRFVVSLMQNATGSDPSAPQIATLVQNLTITTSDNTIKVTVSIPENQLENLIQGGVKTKAAVI